MEVGRCTVMKEHTNVCSKPEMSLWCQDFCWRQHFFQARSSILVNFGLNRCLYSGNDNFWMKGRMKEFNHSYERRWTVAFTNMFDIVIVDIFCLRQHFFDPFFRFWPPKWQNDVTWRHVTSTCRIFTKLSENVSRIDMKLWSKYQVVCII